MAAARDWLVTDGQCAADLHPYRKVRGPLLVPSSKAFTDARTRTVNSLQEHPVDVQVLKDEFASGLPVVAVIELFRSVFSAGSTGELVLPSTGEYRIGLHAVLLVALEGNPVGIHFLNSWGKLWGEKGFGYFPLSYFQRHCQQLWTIKKGQGK